MFKDIVQKIKAADVVGRFIYANVIVYVFVLLIAYMAPEAPTVSEFKAIFSSAICGIL